jgi:hypothetical protein
MSNIPKWKEGWKVLAVGANGDKRMSCTTDDVKPVMYEKNKVVGRRKYCGPLTVFLNKQYAQHFLKTYCGQFRYIANSGVFTIVKCLYIPSKHRWVWEPLYNPRLIFPPGTMLAEKIKCLEGVEDIEMREDACILSILQNKEKPSEPRNRRN